MRVVKTGGKWSVEGEGDGWIFKKTFPTKWKAVLALEVFQQGGRVSGYWERARDEAPPPKQPYRAMEEIKKSLAKIEGLGPTCEDIIAYAARAEHGTVTKAHSDEYFRARIHDTWGVKSGGRVHIDLGCAGHHLMLDRRHAKEFIKFIEDRRPPSP